MTPGPDHSTRFAALGQQACYPGVGRCLGRRCRIKCGFRWQHDRQAADRHPASYYLVRACHRHSANLCFHSHPRTLARRGFRLPHPEVYQSCVCWQALLSRRLTGRRAARAAGVGPARAGLKMAGSRRGLVADLAWAQGHSTSAAKQACMDQTSRGCLGQLRPRGAMPAGL